MFGGCSPPKHSHQISMKGAGVVRSFWQLMLIFPLAVLVGGFAAWGTDMTGNTHDVPTGSTAYGLDLPQLTQYVAIKAHDADISVETFKDGTQVDSLLVEFGVPIGFHTWCDSINIIRTSATRVTVMTAGPNFDLTPFVGGGFDRVALAEKEPVYFDDYRLFFEKDYLGGDVDSFTSIAVVPVTGATALWVHVAWDSLIDNDVTGTGYIKFKNMIAPSSAADDTLSVTWRTGSYADDYTSTVDGSAANSGAAGYYIFEVPMYSERWFGNHHLTVILDSCKVYDLTITDWVVW